MIRLESKVSFKKTQSKLQRLSSIKPADLLAKYAREGVAALSSATPVDSGVSASSWDYTIESSRDSTTITWINSNTVNGVPLVILLQYGHGTGTGGYVQGYDFINPAIRPIFEKLRNDVRKAVTSA